MTHLNKGDKAPDFNAITENGNPVSLKDYSGKKLILFFYPKDMTPGCTNAACSLRDGYKELQNHGYEILGVSPDNEKRHLKFIEKYNFPFSLIADNDKQVIKDYGLWGLKKFMGREYEGVFRTTFVINEKGFIDHVFTKVKTKDHATQILDQLTN